MAHAAVHWHLHKTWLRGIVQPSSGYFLRVLFWIKLFVSFNLPILIPLLVEFEGKTGKILMLTSMHVLRSDALDIWVYILLIKYKNMFCCCTMVTSI